MVLAEFIKVKHVLYESCGLNVHHGYNARTMFTPTMLSRGRILSTLKSSISRIKLICYIPGNVEGVDVKRVFEVECKTVARTHVGAELFATFESERKT